MFSATLNAGHRFSFRMRLAAVCLTAAGVLGLAGLGPAQAGVVTWTGANSLNWNDGLNWDNPGGAPPGTGDDLVFVTGLSLVPNLPTNNDIAADTEFNTLTFNNNIGVALTGLNRIAGSSIKLTAGMTNSSAYAVDLGLAITMTGAQTWTNNLGAGLLTVSGATIDNGGLKLTVDAFSDVTIRGALRGAGDLEKREAGTLLLSGDNQLYTGTTTVTAGTLRLGHDNALGGTANGTVVSTGATLDLNGRAIGNEGMNIDGAGVGSNGALLNNSLTASLDGGISLAGDSTIGGSGNMVLRGVMSGAYNLTKAGSGSVFLTGVNTFGSALAPPKTITLSGGTLSVFKPSNLGDASNKVIFSGGRLQVTDGAAVGAVAPTFGQGLQVDADATIDVSHTSGGKTAVFSGALTGGLGGGDPPAKLTLTKTGRQALRLLGDATANTFAGHLVLAADGGTVTVAGTAGALPNVASITINPIGTGAFEINNNLPAGLLNTRVNDAAPITMKGGTIRYVGATDLASAETLGDLTVASGHNWIDVSKNGSGTAYLTFNSFTRNSGATLVFNSGMGTGVASEARILFTSSPPVTIGGTLGTPQAAVIPAARQGTTTNPTFLTYDANGVRVLDLTNEYYAGNITDASAAVANVKVTTAQTVDVTSANKLINSLWWNTTTGNHITINAGATLTIQSGNVLKWNDQDNNLAGPGTITAGKMDGSIPQVDLVFFQNRAKTITISAIIADNLGTDGLPGGGDDTAVALVKDGAASGIISLTQTADNTYSGGTFVNTGGLNTGATANLRYLGSGKAEVNGNARLTLGAIGASGYRVADGGALNDPTYKATAGGQIELANAARAAHEFIYIGAGSGITGTATALSSYTRDTTITLERDAVVGQRSFLNNGTNGTGTNTIQGLGANADLFYGIAGGDANAGNSQGVTIGTGTPWKGMSTERGNDRRWNRGTITASPGTTDIYFQGLSGPGRPNDAGYAQVLFIGAPATAAQYATITAGSPVVAHIVGNGTVALDDSENAFTNISFAVEPGATLRLSQAGALGAGLVGTGAPVTVYGGGTLDVTSATAANGPITVNPDGRLLASAAAAIDGSGSMTFLPNSIVDVANAGALGAGGTKLTDSINAVGRGVIVRIDVGSPNYLGVLSGQAVYEVFGASRAISGATSGGISLSGGLLTNDNADRTLSGTNAVSVGLAGGAIAASSGTTLTVSAPVDATGTVTFGYTGQPLDGIETKLGKLIFQGTTTFFSGFAPVAGFNSDVDFATGNNVLTLNGTSQWTDPASGILLIHTGKAGTNYIQGTGTINLGGGRTIKAYVDENNQTYPQLVNEIGVRVALGDGAVGTLFAERGVDVTSNHVLGRVWFKDVRLGAIGQAAAPQVNFQIGNSQYLQADLTLLADATASNSSSDTQISISSVSPGPGVLTPPTLTIGGANSTSVTGPVTANVRFQGASGKTLTLTGGYTLASNASVESAGATVLLSGALTTEPNTGTMIASTGDLTIEYGKAGSAGWGSGLAINVTGTNRTVTVKADRTGNPTNVIQAAVSFAPGATGNLTSANGSGSSGGGTVIWDDVRLGVGSAATLVRSGNTVGNTFDISLVGFSQPTDTATANSSHDTEIVLRDITGTGTLIIGGTNTTQMIGAVNSNLRFTGASGKLLNLRDGYVLGSGKTVEVTAGIAQLEKSLTTQPNSGTYNLNGGDMNIYYGSNGQGGGVGVPNWGAGLAVNLDGGSFLQVYAQDGVVGDPQIVNQIDGTFTVKANLSPVVRNSISCHGYISSIRDGGDTTNNGKVFLPNVTLENGAILQLREQNTIDIQAGGTVGTQGVTLLGDATISSTSTAGTLYLGNILTPLAATARKLTFTNGSTSANTVTYKLLGSMTPQTTIELTQGSAADRIANLTLLTDPTAGFSGTDRGTFNLLNQGNQLSLWYNTAGWLLGWGERMDINVGVLGLSGGATIRGYTDELTGPPNGTPNPPRVINNFNGRVYVADDGTAAIDAVLYAYETADAAAPRYGGFFKFNNVILGNGATLGLNKNDDQRTYANLTLEGGATVTQTGDTTLAHYVGNVTFNGVGGTLTLEATAADRLRVIGAFADGPSGSASKIDRIGAVDGILAFENNGELGTTCSLSGQTLNLVSGGETWIGTYRAEYSSGPNVYYPCPFGAGVINHDQNAGELKIYTGSNGNPADYLSSAITVNLGNNRTLRAYVDRDGSVTNTVLAAINVKPGESGLLIPGNTYGSLNSGSIVWDDVRIGKDSVLNLHRAAETLLVTADVTLVGMAAADTATINNQNTSSDDKIAVRDVSGTGTVIFTGSAASPSRVDVIGNVNVSGMQVGTATLISRLRIEPTATLTLTNPVVPVGTTDGVASYVTLRRDTPGITYDIANTSSVNVEYGGAMTIVPPLQLNAATLSANFQGAGTLNLNAGSGYALEIASDNSGLSGPITIASGSDTRPTGMNSNNILNKAIYILGHANAFGTGPSIGAGSSEGWGLLLKSGMTWGLGKTVGTTTAGYGGVGLGVTGPAAAPAVFQGTMQWGSANGWLFTDAGSTLEFDANTILDNEVSTGNYQYVTKIGTGTLRFGAGFDASTFPVDQRWGGTVQAFEGVIEVQTAAGKEWMPQALTIANHGADVVFGGTNAATLRIEVTRTDTKNVSFNKNDGPLGSTASQYLDITGTNTWTTTGTVTIGSGTQLNRTATGTWVIGGPMAVDGIYDASAAIGTTRIVTGGRVAVAAGADYAYNDVVILDGGVYGAGNSASYYFTRNLGTNNGEIYWTNSTNGGGFASGGSTGTMTVQLNSLIGDPLVWGVTPNFVRDGAPLRFYTGSGGAIDFQNQIDLAGTAATRRTLDGIGDPGGNVTFSGQITGAAGIEKTGSDPYVRGPTISLGNGSNSFTGDVIVTKGYLRAAAPGTPLGAGSPTSTLAVGLGGTLQVDPGSGTVNMTVGTATVNNDGLMHVVSGVADFGTRVITMTGGAQPISTLTEYYAKPSDVGATNFAAADPYIRFENANNFITPDPGPGGTPGSLTTGTRLNFSASQLNTRSGNYFGGGDNVGVAWEGEITVGGAIPAGSVSFGTSSDDGSSLYVDYNGTPGFQADELVVNNLGTHGQTTRTGMVNLLAGTYKFRIGYYDNTGGDIIQVRFGAGQEPNFWHLMMINPGGPMTNSIIQVDAGAELKAGGLTAYVLNLNGAAGNPARVTLANATTSAASFLNLNGTTPDATVDLAAGHTLTATNIALAAGAKLTLSNDGLLKSTGNQTWGDNATVTVAGGPSGGTLRYELPGGQTVNVGSGNSITVNANNTLELAGSQSALADSITLDQYVDILNDSTTLGVVVSGTNQEVGNITGTGTTTVQAGADLTATYVKQGSVVLAGLAGSPAKLVIRPSGSSGGLGLAPDRGAAALTGGGALAGGGNAVPEPGTLLLLAIGGLCLAGYCWRRKRGK